MVGAYYLHTNGDLIWKPEAVFYGTTVEDYFDSVLVVRYWVIPKKSPTGDVDCDLWWFMDNCLEALRQSRNKEVTYKRIVDIWGSIGCDEALAKTIIDQECLHENKKRG